MPKSLGFAFENPPALNQARRAHEGRNCGATEIQRIAENASRWPDMNLADEYESEASC
jgi:hypothetical protein